MYGDAEAVRVARLAAADQECMDAYDRVLSMAARLDGMDIIEATRLLGYHLGRTNRRDDLSFTLAYLALRSLRGDFGERTGGAGRLDG